SSSRGPTITPPILDTGHQSDIRGISLHVTPHVAALMRATVTDFQASQQDYQRGKRSTRGQALCDRDTAVGVRDRPANIDDISAGPGHRPLRRMYLTVQLLREFAPEFDL